MYNKVVAGTAYDDYIQNFYVTNVYIYGNAGNDSILLSDKRKNNGDTYSISNNKFIKK